MGKERSFAVKVAKAHMAPANVCTVCGEAKNTIQYVKSTKHEEKGTWRFKERYVGVCKCNEKEIYG